MKMVLNVNSGNNMDKANLEVNTARDCLKPKHQQHIKNRHSLGIFHGLKIKALHNPFSTVIDNSPSKISSPNKRPVTIQRSSSTTKSFLKASANVLLQKRNVQNDIRSEC